MKKLFKLNLLLAIASIAMFSNPLHAQDATKELAAFAKKWEAAYNKQDAKTLKTMYTDNAERVSQQGETVTGKENIVAQYVTQWTDSKLTIEIKPGKAETQADGTVIGSGTYHVKGTAKSGEKVELNGSYTNTVAKEDGKWKISKSVLTAL